MKNLKKTFLKKLDCYRFFFSNFKIFKKDLRFYEKSFKYPKLNKNMKNIKKNFFPKNLKGIKKFFLDLKIFQKDLRFYENPLSTPKLRKL